MQRIAKASRAASLRRRAPFGLLVLLLALIVGACSGAASSSGGGGSSGLGVPDLTIVPYQGDVLGSEEVTLSAVFERTGKPLVLNFWAGLCPPCRAEMPDFQEVYEERGGDFLMLGIDIGPFQLLGTRQEGQELLRQLNLTYPAGTTFDADILREYKILGMPTTFFIAKDGTVVKRFAGLLTKDKINELIDEIIAESL